MENEPFYVGSITFWPSEIGDWGGHEKTVAKLLNAELQRRMEPELRWEPGDKFADVLHEEARRGLQDELTEAAVEGPEGLLAFYRMSWDHIMADYGNILPAGVAADLGLKPHWPYGKAPTTDFGMRVARQIEEDILETGTARRHEHGAALPTLSHARAVRGALRSLGYGSELEQYTGDNQCGCRWGVSVICITEDARDRLRYLQEARAAEAAGCGV